MDWINVLQTLGVSVSMLVFIGWSGIQFARWLGPRLDRIGERVFAAADKVQVFEERLAKTEQQVHTVWEFILRRAHVEALKSGAATMNSPIKVTSEAQNWLKDMAIQLKAFYQRLGRQVTDIELMIAIEQEFGERLVKEVCIPHGMFQGACLLIAMQVAKGEMSKVEGGNLTPPPATRSEQITSKPGSVH